MTVARVRFGPEVFRFQDRGGVSRYVVELHRALLARGVDSAIEAGLHRSRLLDGVAGVHGRSVAGLRPEGVRQATTLVVDRVVAARARARLGAADVWHPSYFDRIPSGRSALAVTVYDMVHERYPEGSGPRRDRTVRYKAEACQAADVVLCISRTTAEDVADLLGLDADRLVVTPLGVTVVEPEPVAALPHDGPTLLFVGDRRPAYKGWLALLDALAAGPSELGLLCVGPPASQADIEAIAAAGLIGRVHLESPTDGQLAARYRQVTGLVYPSRYEGFGLPPLEALAHGCPVVAGDCGAVREAVGGVALLVEPSVDGIGDGIGRLLADGPDVARQRTDGPGHAARFTWAATAEATLAGYERVVG